MATTNANVREALEELLRTALGEVAPECARTPIHLERPKQAGHGDFASNLAMQLARTLKCNPRELAQRLVAALPESALVDKVEVAGAGFINFSLSQAAQTAVVAAVLAAGEHYGRGAQRDERIMVEFVSANPTGPLHVGHGRGAAYGASLANLLEFAGYDVEREYYVNDAGRQMDILALSTWLRYLGLHGVDVPFPPNAYRGEYVIDMARAVRERHGDAFVVREIAQVLADVPPLPDADDTTDPAKRVREAHLDALIANARRLLGEGYATIHSMALSIQLEDCRDDLAEFGVYYDTWFSERSLFDHDLIARALRVLEENGHLYEQDGARWFRSTHFGDEKDRVVQRENGQYTYFASDIAYHQNKFERGFDRVINVWGADHHGYIARVKGALTALGLDAERLQVALVQFAVLYRNGEKASMSTRAGEFVTLRQLREEVGADACRFFYVLRKSDQHLDFDLDLATSESADNPVYYVQYAHARICSVLGQWGGNVAALNEAALDALTHPRELALCTRLAAWPEVIAAAAADFAPHVVAFYLKDLAADFHAWYNAQRMLVEDEATRLARLALAAAVRNVLAGGLALLGVEAKQSM